MQKKNEFCLGIHSVSLFLCIGELNTLIIRDISDHLLLLLVCFVLVVGCEIVGCYPPLFSFGYF